MDWIDLAQDWDRRQDLLASAPTGQLIMKCYKLIKCIRIAAPFWRRGENRQKQQISGRDSKQALGVAIFRF